MSDARQSAKRAIRNAKSASREAQRQGREAMRSGRQAMAEARRQLRETARELKRAAKIRRASISKKAKPKRTKKVRPKKPPQLFRIKKVKRTKRKSPIRKALKKVFGTRSSYRRVKRRPLGADLRRRVQQALRELRQGKAFDDVSQSVGIPPSRLRNTLLERHLVREQGGELIPTRRGRARMRFFSAGAIQAPLVSWRTATKIGRYMSAVARFLPTGDLELLKPFEGATITDVAGRRYVFETRPNILYSLSAETEKYEEIYELVA